MARNWGEEWNVLVDRERLAFKRYRDLQFAVIGHFQQSGNPPDSLLTEAETAHAEWREATAACDAFIEEYRNS